MPQILKIEFKRFRKEQDDSRFDFTQNCTLRGTQLILRNDIVDALCFLFFGEYLWRIPGDLYKTKRGDYEIRLLVKEGHTFFIFHRIGGNDHILQSFEANPLFVTIKDSLGKVKELFGKEAERVRDKLFIGRKNLLFASLYVRGEAVTDLAYARSADKACIFRSALGSDYYTRLVHMLKEKTTALSKRYSFLQKQVEKTYEEAMGKGNSLFDSGITKMLDIRAAAFNKGAIMQQFFEHVKSLYFNLNQVTENLRYRISEVLKACNHHAYAYQHFRAKGGDPTRVSSISRRICIYTRYLSLSKEVTLTHRLLKAYKDSFAEFEDILDKIQSRRVDWEKTIDAMEEKPYTVKDVQDVLDCSRYYLVNPTPRQWKTGQALMEDKLDYFFCLSSNQELTTYPDIYGNLQDREAHKYLDDLFRDDPRYLREDYVNYREQDECLASQQQYVLKAVTGFDVWTKEGRDDCLREVRKCGVPEYCVQMLEREKTFINGLVGEIEIKKAKSAKEIETLESALAQLDRKKAAFIIDRLPYKAVKHNLDLMEKELSTIRAEYRKTERKIDLDASDTVEERKKIRPELVHMVQNLENLADRLKDIVSTYDEERKNLGAFMNVLFNTFREADAMYREMQICREEYATALAYIHAISGEGKISATLSRCTGVSFQLEEEKENARLVLSRANQIFNEWAGISVVLSYGKSPDQMSVANYDLYVKEGEVRRPASSLRIDYRYLLSAAYLFALNETCLKIKGHPFRGTIILDRMPTNVSKETRQKILEYINKDKFVKYVYLADNEELCRPTIEKINFRDG